MNQELYKEDRKIIGILACSAEGAALAYRTICLEGQNYLGEHMHPEVILHGHALGLYMIPIREGGKEGWREVGALMQDSYERLVSAGAEVIICPDNTIHQAYDHVQQKASVQWLHIARVVAAEASRQGYKRLAVLGTRYLMEGPVYAEALKAASIERHIPNETERVEINRIIFEELVNGIFSSEARTYFVAVINRLKELGCDAVVLGCTEIPLLIGEADSPLPVLDSTRLLARAALLNSCSCS